MRIDSLHILEIGDFAFFKSVRPTQVTYVYLGKKHPDSSQHLTYAKFRQLRRELKAGRYDMVVFTSFGLTGVPWHPDRSLFSNLVRTGRSLFGRFYDFGTWIILWLLRDLDVPFIVYDRKDDPNTIPSQYLPLLKKCEFYFWRECPIKLEQGFFSTSYLRDTSAVRKSDIFRNNQHKIVPISLGADHDQAFSGIDLQAEKTIDVFFAGSLKDSHVREAGAKLLRDFAAEGIRIEVNEAVKYSRSEFLKRCSESWLVWSPEGHGWDCYRHYEVCLAGSIPVMNYPRTRRYQPLIDGVHGFYYGVEGEDLKRVIKLALADKEKLRTRAIAGRQHALAFHTYDKIATYMLSRLFPS